MLEMLGLLGGCAMPKRASRCAAGVLLLLGLLASACATTAEPVERDLVLGTPGFRVRKPVKTWRDIRYRNVVPQQYDYSCGAAALATLLQYHYGDAVGELTIIQTMLRLGDQDRIRQEGFSLLDLKRYADERGYETRAFRISADGLSRLAIPAVTLIETRGFTHFVVIKGMRDDQVYLADPALGTRRVPKDEFLAQWKDVVLFVAARRNDANPSPLQVLQPSLAGPRYAVTEVTELGNLRLGFDRNEF